MLLLRHLAPKAVVTTAVEKTYVLFTGQSEKRVVFVSLLIATLLLNTQKDSWASGQAVRRRCVSLCLFYSFKQKMSNNRSPALRGEGRFSVILSILNGLFLGSDKWLPGHCGESKSGMRSSKKHLTKRTQWCCGWEQEVASAAQRKPSYRDTFTMKQDHVLHLRLFIVENNRQTHKHYLHLVDRLERQVGLALLKLSLPVSSSSVGF